MTDLQIRKIDWHFEPDTTPFVWNPSQPDFSVLTNAISFIAPPLERYIVAVMQMAKDAIDDQAALAEADAFLRQEALHARAHRGHVNAIVAQHPGLADTVERMNHSFDDLLENEDLPFHLAFVAGLEATFTPIFREMLEKESTFFVGGADNVASLFLWHFVEEVEHRSSALIVYRSIVPDDEVLLRVRPRALDHMTTIVAMAVEGFFEHVDGCPVLGDDAVLTLLPSAAIAVDESGGAPDPAAERVPEFAHRWNEAYDAGVDVRSWYAATAS